MSESRIPADLIEELMDRFGVPGLAVGITRGDEVDVAGFGVTNVDHPLPVDGDTLFQIGSITKTYTATAAMRLVEAGQLELDAPVRSYLPDLRLADEQVARVVTMRHLLTHTGGWEGDYFAMIGRGDDALARMVERLDSLEQLAPPGEIWAYNNAGFYIAGRVIEVVTGKPFELALHELVLEPLGLERSFFFADEVITHRFAVGHHRPRDVATPWSIGRPAAAAGGIVASPRDVLRYARAIWRPEGFLTTASVAEMRRPQMTISRGLRTAIGLGWFVSERDGHTMLSHNGGTNGQVSILAVLPEDRLALTVLVNHDLGGAVMPAIANEILRRELGLELPEASEVDVDAERLAGYVGKYENRMTKAEITLVDGRLVLELAGKGGFPDSDSPPAPGPPPTRLVFRDEDAFEALDPPLQGMRGDFIRDAKGELAWFRWASRLFRPKT